VLAYSVSVLSAVCLPISDFLERDLLATGAGEG
jgi:hypothetical protein